MGFKVFETSLLCGICLEKEGVVTAFTNEYPIDTATLIQIGLANRA